MDNADAAEGYGSRAHRPKALRVLASKFDEDTVGCGGSSLSPITYLAHNLSGTSLDSTPSKRAIFDDIYSSPVSTKGFSDVSPGKAHSSNRLSKCGENCDTSNKEKENSVTVSPLDVMSMLGSPEKRHIVDKDTRTLVRSRPALASIDVNSALKENSYVKPGTSGNGPVRMPSIEEHDASSRDSGCDPGDAKTFKYPEPVLLRRSTKSVNSPASTRSLTLSRSSSSSSGSRKTSGVARLDFSSCSDDDEGLPADFYESACEDDPFPLSSSIRKLCEDPVTASARALMSAVDETDATWSQASTSNDEQRQQQAAAQHAAKPCLTRSLSMFNYGTPNTRLGYGSPMQCGSPMDSAEDTGSSPVAPLGLHLFKRQPARLLRSTLNQSVKRSPPEEATQANKRRKSDGSDDSAHQESRDENEDPACQESRDLTAVTKPRFHRSHSETDAIVMRALQSSSEDPNLIGDSSRRYALPLVVGKHSDLKCISPRTMVDLLNGKFSSVIEKFVVVDCRYPYEFNGGHIRGAVNLYQEDMIWENFLRDRTGLPTPQPGVKTELRNILIFHCEFSSERGPKMSRFLRKMDRDQNKEHYPALHWPEIYLLEGGYKKFFYEFKDYCEPQNYTPMLQMGYEDELRRYRSRSKSFKREGTFSRHSSKSSCRTLFGP